MSADTSAAKAAALRRPSRPDSFTRPERPDSFVRPVRGQPTYPRPPRTPLAPGTKLLSGGLMATPEQWQQMPGWLQRHAQRHGPRGSVLSHFQGPVLPPGAITPREHREMLQDDRYSGGLPRIDPNAGSGPVGPWMDQQLENVLAGRPVDKYVDSLTATLRSRSGRRDDHATQGG